METIQLDLSRPQLSKLQRGMPVQVSHTKIGSGMALKVHPATARKVHSAKRRQKGVRVCLGEEEVMGSGLSWKGFKRGLKTAAKVARVGAKAAYKGYQQYVKPIVGPEIRKGLKKISREGLPILAAMTGQPELVAAAQALQPAVERGIDIVGEKTGAYGVGAKRRVRVRSRAPRPNASMVHGLPAMNPLLDVGNLYQGQDFIRGVGLGLTLGGALYLQ